MIQWVLPLDIITPNTSEHWSKQYARNKKNKLLMAAKWSFLKEKPKPPLYIILERLYDPSKRQKLYDLDNIVGAFKGVQDSIADLIIPGLLPGRADAPSLGLQWQYTQTAASEKGCRITIKSPQEYYDDMLAEALETRKIQMEALKNLKEA